MMKLRSLYLVRHAHRETLNRTDDNALSEKGQKQAAQLRVYFEPLLLRQNQFELVSSPKLRCQETLQALSKAFEVPIKIDLDLVEQQQNETENQFSKRIENFLQTWSERNIDLSIACSHGDWIPEALFQLFQVRTDIKKSGIAHLQLNGSSWQLADLLQNPN